MVDPQRDVAQYLADAEANGLHIERVIETHFHADFVSGHLELAAPTGAAISYGAGCRRPAGVRHRAPRRRPAPVASARCSWRSAPRPGTRRSRSASSCTSDADDEPAAVLTGDTLFIGDVGRPDLLASVGVTSDELARQLYHSLHTQLLTLPDATKVYPAHGAGSACGKNLSTETVSTIGEQRLANYALAPMTRGRVRRPGHRGPARRAAVLRLRRQPQPRGPRACSTRTVHSPRSTSTRSSRSRPQGPSCSTPATRPTSPPATSSGRSTWGSAGRFAEYAGDVVRHDQRDRPRRRSRHRARGQGPPGPDRLRPRGRRARPPAAGLRRAARRGRVVLPAHRARAGPPS